MLTREKINRVRKLKARTKRFRQIGTSVDGILGTLMFVFFVADGSLFLLLLSIVHLTAWYKCGREEG